MQQWMRDAAKRKQRAGSSSVTPTGGAAWVELFDGTAAEGGWLHVDPLAGAVDAAAAVEGKQRAGPAVTYVVAFSAGGGKDVTRRYCSSFMKSLKARDEKWWQPVVAPLRKVQVPIELSLWRCKWLCLPEPTCCMTCRRVHVQLQSAL